MNGLINTYCNDKLTPDELTKLNGYLDSASEDKITEEMRDIWNDDIDTSAIDNERIAMVKKRVDCRLGESMSKSHHATHSISPFRLWLYRAVAVLFPLFVLSTIYLLYENGEETTVVPSQLVTVFTARGERASVQLPDGTNVVLSYDSRLEYDASRFTANRNVRFSGEAYFKVAKDRQHPFTVSSPKLKVEVLGTKFNICARYQRTGTAGLVLDEGRVKFTSLATNESVIIKAGEAIAMDYGTGRIRRESQRDRRLTYSWQQNAIKYVHADFNSIISEMEQVYGVSITLTPMVRNLKPFTGTLPLNDLDEVKRILEVCYALNIEQDNKHIIISK